ncbi:fimbrial protein [Salmonella enterica subsp. enterica serovar Kotte]|nr:fimbrial protein [Salmonella enterica subsp. enterica serovar Kotte]
MLRKAFPPLIIIYSLLVLGFLPCPVFSASTDCYIQRNAAGNYNVTIEPVNVVIPLAKYDTPSEVQYVNTYDFSISLRGDKIGCKMQSGGDTSVHFINTSDAALQTNYTAGTGGALMKTTVAGITYSAELFCDSCGGTSVALNLLPNGADNASDTSTIDYPWEYTDDKWKLRFRIFQTPDFKPTNGVSSGQSIAGKLATWRLGHSGQPEVNFFVTADSLHFDVSQPTCGMLSVTGDAASGNQVALGNYYVSELQKGLSREVPFTLRGDYCGAEKITVKMTAATRSSDASLIGKSSGSAEGVGVKIVSTADNSNTLVKPDGSNAIVFNYADWWGNIREFPFTAQLVADGAPINTGTFTGNATFTFSYE